MGPVNRLEYSTSDCSFPQPAPPSVRERPGKLGISNQNTLPVDGSVDKGSLGGPLEQRILNTKIVQRRPHAVFEPPTRDFPLTDKKSSLVKRLSSDGNIPLLVSNCNRSFSNQTRLPNSVGIAPRNLTSKANSVNKPISDGTEPVGDIAKAFRFVREEILDDSIPVNQLLERRSS